MNYFQDHDRYTTLPFNRRFSRFLVETEFRFEFLIRKYACAENFEFLIRRYACAENFKMRQRERPL